MGPTGGARAAARPGVHAAIVPAVVSVGISMHRAPQLKGIHVQEDVWSADGAGQVVRALAPATTAQGGEQVGWAGSGSAQGTGRGAMRLLGRRRTTAPAPARLPLRHAAPAWAALGNPALRAPGVGAADGGPGVAAGGANVLLRAAVLLLQVDILLRALQQRFEGGHSTHTSSVLAAAGGGPAPRHPSNSHKRGHKGKLLAQAMPGGCWGGPAAGAPTGHMSHARHD